MSDKKISQLTSVNASNITGAEELPIVQSSETKKTTLEDVQHYVVNHLEPTILTIEDGDTIDLGNAAYDESELIVLSWTGGNGTATITLPDVTLAKNLNRSKRIITDGTFSNSTHAQIFGYNSQTVDGSTGAVDINRAYEGINVWGNGTEWFIIQKKA